MKLKLNKTHEQIFRFEADVQRASLTLSHFQMEVTYGPKKKREKNLKKLQFYNMWLSPCKIYTYSRWLHITVITAGNFVRHKNKT